MNQESLKELQALTGTGLMVCQRALEVSHGSVQKAARRLRLSGEAPQYHRKGRPSGIDPAVAQKGYRFDTWADETAGRIDSQLGQLKTADPPSIVNVQLMDLSRWPDFVEAKLANGTLIELDPYQGWDVNAFPIPDSVDDEDLTLELFFERNLDNPALEIEAFTLGDQFKLPGALWRLALHQISRHVMELSAARSSPLSSCVVSIHDETLKASDEEFYWGWVQKGIVKHLADDALFAAFQTLVYESPSMQGRLIKLRTGTP